MLAVIGLPAITGMTISQRIGWDCGEYIRQVWECSSHSGLSLLVKLGFLQHKTEKNTFSPCKSEVRSFLVVLVFSKISAILHLLITNGLFLPCLGSDL